MIGLIGDDENGRIIQKEFAEDGMDTTGIEVVKGEHSSFTWIPVDVQGERCIYMFPNVTAKVTPKQIRERFARHIRQEPHGAVCAPHRQLYPIWRRSRATGEIRRSVRHHGLR